MTSSTCPLTPPLLNCLMNDSVLPLPVHDWLIETIGSDVVLQAARELAGSTTSTLYALEMQRNRQPLQLVLRLFTWADFVADEPDAPLHEAAALRKAASAGLPAPELVAVDASGAGCGVPAVLMTRLPGTVNLRPVNPDDWLYRLAAALVPIHAVNADDFQWIHFLWTALEHQRAPEWSHVPDAWTRAVEIVQGPEPAYHPCFVHRDYHPTNVLWENGHVSGVVDWVSACRGPAGIDVGHCRVNLASLYGTEAADTFLRAYESLSGVEQHPYWDLLALVDVLPDWGMYQPWHDFGLTSLTDALVRSRLEDFLVRVLARLG